MQLKWYRASIQGKPGSVISELELFSEKAQAGAPASSPDQAATIQGCKPELYNFFAPNQFSVLRHLLR